MILKKNIEWRFKKITFNEKLIFFVGIIFIFLLPLLIRGFSFYGDTGFHIRNIMDTQENKGLQAYTPWFNSGQAVDYPPYTYANIAIFSDSLGIAPIILYRTFQALFILGIAFFMFYIISNLLNNKNAAILATILFIISPVPIKFNTDSITSTSATFCGLVAVYYLLNYFKKEKKVSQLLISCIFISGMYYIHLLTPVIFSIVFLSVIIAELNFNKKVITNFLRAIFPILIMSLLFLLPLFFYNYNNQKIIKEIAKYKTNVNVTEPKPLDLSQIVQYAPNYVPHGTESTEYIKHLFGVPILVMGLLGLIVLLLSNKFGLNKKVGIFLLSLGIGFPATGFIHKIYIIMGYRFIIFCFIPLFILTAIFISSMRHKKKQIVTFIVMILMIVLFVFNIKYITPRINKGEVDAIKWMKKNTSSDSKVISWYTDSTLIPVYANRVSVWSLGGRVGLNRREAAGKCYSLSRLKITDREIKEIFDYFEADFFYTKKPPVRFYPEDEVRPTVFNGITQRQMEHLRASSVLKVLYENDKAIIFKIIK
ncbi:MAG: hypothetical protein ACTSPD_20205 [Promethearchaeota archaeon]